MFSDLWHNRARTFAFVAFTVLLSGAHAVQADEKTSIVFGGTEVSLPHPEGYCELTRDTPQEDLIYAWNERSQRSATNKFLGMWVICSVLDDIKSMRAVNYIGKYLIVVAALGPDDLESVYPDLSLAEYKQAIMQQLDGGGFERILRDSDDSIKDAIRDANTRYLKDPEALTYDKPMSFGVLKATDSIHSGVAMKVQSAKAAINFFGIASTTIVRGVVTHFYFYEEFDGPETLERLLKEAVAYSSRLHQLN